MHEEEYELLHTYYTYVWLKMTPLLVQSGPCDLAFYSIAECNSQNLCFKLEYLIMVM